MGETWDAVWAHKLRKTVRKERFMAFRRRESALDSIASRINKHLREQMDGQTPILIFGNAADHGAFNRLRGTHRRKPPVLAVKRRLARVMIVISGDEYNTTNLDSTCGRRNRILNHGVCFCPKQNGAPKAKDAPAGTPLRDLDHHRHLNRDVAAALCIVMRFYAKWLGRDLGPWTRGSARDSHITPSGALSDPLCSLDFGSSTA